MESSNWRQGEMRPFDLPTAAFTDVLGGENVFFGVPIPQCDLDATAIVHWGQAFYIGSLTPGHGRPVQSDYIQTYLGKAGHTSILSPVP
jgi:hypothetical protein